MSTLEIAYAKSYEDAAGDGDHAEYGTEVLELTRLLAEMVPDEPGAHALAALVRYTEARRPARVDAQGAIGAYQNKIQRFGGARSLKKRT